MKKEQDNHDNVEIFTEDSVITLYDEENNPIDFFEIASIEYEEKFYELLQPVETIEGVDEDEAVIFEYSVDEDDEKLFKPIFDEELLESVFSLYLAASADFESCGCGCDSCGHGHDCAHEEHAEKPAKKPAEKSAKKPAEKSAAKKQPPKKKSE